MWLQRTSYSRLRVSTLASQKRERWINNASTTTWHKRGVRVDMLLIANEEYLVVVIVCRTLLLIQEDIGVVLDVIFNSK
jgi:hypothetical protein